MRLLWTTLNATNHHDGVLFANAFVGDDVLKCLTTKKTKKLGGGATTLLGSEPCDLKSSEQAFVFTPIATAKEDILVAEIQVQQSFELAMPG